MSLKRVLVASLLCAVSFFSLAVDFPAGEQTNVTALIIVMKDGSVSKKSTASPEFAGVKPAKRLLKDKALPTSKKNVKGATVQSRAAQNLNNMYRAELETGATLDDVLKAVRRDPRVLYAEPDSRVTIQTAPNDTWFNPEQWSLNNTGQVITAYNSGGNTPYTNGTADADIDWLEAYEGALFPTNEIIVAVIDTGVYYDHPDLTNRMWRNPGEIPGNGIDDDNNSYVDDIYGIDTVNGDSDPKDDNCHGTHCAGTIAAQVNNAFGIAGVNPHAKVMALKFLSYEGSGDTSAAIELIEYAVKMGAKVLSNSWGGGPPSQAMQDVIDYALENGVVFMAAAGNSNVSTPMYPAAYRGAVSVAATDPGDRKASFSNYGKTIDVSAPGVYILSLLAKGGYISLQAPYLVYANDETNMILMSGTSMACPAAAGAMSLLVSKYPGLDPLIYQGVMQETCDDIYSIPANTNYIGKLGAGRINVQRMLTYDETNAFLAAEARISGNRASAGQGEEVPLSVEVAAWAYPVSNLTVTVSVLTTGTTLNATSYSLGDLDALTAVTLPTNAFVATITTNAPWGENQSLRVSLVQGVATVAVQTVNIAIMQNLVAEFSVSDLDGDGTREIIGGLGSAVFSFSPEGVVQWYTEVPYVYGWSIDGVICGDFIGDSLPDVLVKYATNFYLMNGGGTIVTTLPAEASGTLSYDTQNMAVMDLNGDGKDDLLEMQYRYYGGGGYGPALVARNGSTGAMLWDKDHNDYGGGVNERWFLGPAFGDLDGDGTEEIVFADSPKVPLGVAPENSEIAYLIVLGKDGTQRFRKSLGAASQVEGLYLADMDGDGVREIVLQSQYLGGRKDVTSVFSASGDMWPGWPKALLNKTYAVSPLSTVPSDLDGDGDLELIGFDMTRRLLTAYHHDGSFVSGFPIFDEGIDFQYQPDPVIADVDGNGSPDIVYISGLTTNDGNSASFQLTARDSRGLLLNDYPVNYTAAGTVYGFQMMADWLTPSYGGTETNVYILAATTEGLIIRDTGYPYREQGAEWPTTGHDARMSFCHQPHAGDLWATFVSTNRAGTGTLTTKFQSQASGTNLTGLVYRWDFNNDGTPELSGAGLSLVTNTFSVAGTYSVSLTVSNAAGEVRTVTKEDFISVYPAAGVQASFVADVYTASAPITIHFTDTSINGPQTWSWNFGNGGTSTLQNPSHYYSSSGIYTVKLVAASSYNGVNTASTNTCIINLTNTVSGITNHYVSLTGGHRYPFKNWADAATNVIDALAVATDGHQVILAEGTYKRPANLITSDAYWLHITNAVTLRGAGRPDATILDGQSESGIVINHTNAVLDGVTVQNCQHNTGAGIFVGDSDFFDPVHKGGTIRNCIIRNNRAEWVTLNISSGAGIYFDDVPFGLVENCTIVSNTAQSGAALRIDAADGSTVIVRNCTFTGNRGTAGNIISGGTSAVLENCLIYRNSSGDNGIVNARMENCTVVDNVSVLGAVEGLPSWDAEYIRNCIIYSNTPKNFVTGATGTKQYYNLTGMTYCAVSPLPPSGTGNFTNRPTFVNAAAADYRAAASSYTVDRGTNWLYASNVYQGTLLFDLGSSSKTTAGNWNNVTTTGTGVKVADAVYSNGAASGISLVFSNAFEGAIEDGRLHQGVTWPASAYEDSLTVPRGTTNLVRLEGLDVNGLYNIKLLGSTADASNTYAFSYSYYRVGSSAEYAFNNENTNFTPQVFNGVTPSPDGSISLYVRGGSSASYNLALLGVIEVEVYERVESGSSPLLSMTDLDGLARVYNGTVDVGAYEYHGNLAPRAVFGLDGTERRAGHPVSFDGTDSYDADGSIVNYRWDFGDGVVSNGALSTVSHTYAQSGWRTVLLTVTDNGGLTNTASLNLEILPAVPDAPYALEATNDAPEQVTLTWSCDATDETGFRIERHSLLYPGVDVIIDDADGAPQVQYIATYQGSWSTGTHASAYSNGYHTDKGTIEGDVDALIFPQLPADGQYEIFAWWPERGTNNLESANLRIYHSDGDTQLEIDQTRNGGQWNSLGVFNMDPNSFLMTKTAWAYPWRGDYIVDGYRFVQVPVWETVGYAPADTTNYVDLTVVNGRTYTYRVVATNALGDSAPSNEDSVTVLATNKPPVATILDATPVSGTTPLVVSASGIGTDVDGTVTNYLWSFGDGYTGSIQEGANLTNVFFSYKHIGSFELTLTVYDDKGAASTNTATVSIQADPAAPNAPSALSGTLNGSAIDLQWIDHALNETGFELQRKAGSGSYAALVSLPANTQQYSDSTGLAESETYTYRIRTTNELVLSDWVESNPVFFGVVSNYALPFSEPFEALTAGDLGGQHGWTATGTNAAVQNAVAHGGSQALRLQSASAIHVFNGAPTNVTISFYAKPQPQDAPESLPSGSEVVFWMTETNGAIVAYSNSTLVAAGISAVSNDWNFFEIVCDYSSKVWTLAVNGTNAPVSFGFYTGTADGFSEFRVQEQSETGFSYVDDINVTGPDLGPDADFDGLPDSWEEFYYGSNAPNPTDLSSNGINTVREAYIAGFDPTDANAGFGISNVRNVLWWNSASGRVYTVYWTSNLLSGFQTLETNYTGGAFTDTVHGAEQKSFYKIEVQLEQ